jgi:hypothetical protein
LSFQAFWPAQAADSATHRYPRLVTPRHGHLSGRIKDAQFASLSLGKEPGQVHCRPRFILSMPNHRFRAGTLLHVAAAAEFLATALAMRHSKICLTLNNPAKLDHYQIAQGIDAARYG